MTNVVVLTTLFGYTVVVFDTVSHTLTVGLLVVTHVCNFVVVFHVYVMDLMVWYDGWIDTSDVCKTSPEFMSKYLIYSMR